MNFELFKRHMMMQSHDSIDEGLTFGRFGVNCFRKSKSLSQKYEIGKRPGDNFVRM